MTRVKRGVAAHRRHRKIIKAAKGYRNLRNRTFKHAKMGVMKAKSYKFVGRKLKKRTYRRLWITRLNSALRAMNITYSRFIDAMTKKNVLINRKVLSELAINKPDDFKIIVEDIMK